MSDSFHCPYCGHEKNKDTAAHFNSCRFCGFKSALVQCREGKLMIVDRRMPFLKKRCQEISESLPGVTVIVDRRITQDPFADKDRRLIPHGQTA